MGGAHIETVIFILFDLAAPNESDLQPTHVSRLYHVVAVSGSEGV